MELFELFNTINAYRRLGPEADGVVVGGRHLFDETGGGTEVGEPLHNCSIGHVWDFFLFPFFMYSLARGRDCNISK